MIYFLNAVPNVVSGKLADSISDHLPQFLLAPTIFFVISPSLKSNKYERDWPKFDQEDLVLDYSSVDWDKLLLA